MKVRDLIKMLESQYSLDEPICFEIWSVDDVKEMADNLDVTLTDEQAKEVLERMDSNFDATVGNNWDVMEYYIHEVSAE